MRSCEGCDGDGWVEEEFARPQDFNRDVGYLDTRRVECEDCGGTGAAETFRIWFKEGGSVSETWGGHGIITSVDQLRELADQYDFDAEEVLDWGETEMLDEDGDVVGGVVIYAV